MESGLKRLNNKYPFELTEGGTVRNSHTGLGLFCTFTAALPPHHTESVWNSVQMDDGCNGIGLSAVSDQKVSKLM